MVVDFLVNMSASADVLAQAKVEVDLSAIPLGKNVSSPSFLPPAHLHNHTLTQRVYKVIIKWRGKPVFIRHRTPEEIKEAEDTKWENLRDPQPDSDRAKNPEWLIMLGTGFLLFFCFFPSPFCLSRVSAPLIKREREANEHGPKKNIKK